MPTTGRILISAAVVLAGTVSALAGEVKVTGNSRVDTASIVAHVPFEAGTRVTDAALDEAVKSLFASGQFADVKAARAGDGVLVEVVELPLVAAVRFEGNSRLKDSALAKAIGTKAGFPMEASRLDGDVAAISSAYASTGRVDATVRRETVNLPGNRTEVVFTVDEGEKTGVSKVWFKGNESFPDSRLRSVVSTKESGVFSWFLGNDVYDIDRVAADREAIRAFYVSQGFADARVLLSDVDRHEEGFLVGFVIEEGPRYTIGKTVVESTVKGFDSTGVLASAKKIEGRSFTPERLSETADGIADRAVLAGHSFAGVEVRTDRRPDGTADVAFLVDDGPRIYIERIEVAGNTRTRDHVIRRELDFSEGDALNRVLVKRAERRLNALGLFDKVAISLHPGEAEDKAVLRIEVADRKTGEFSVGGGWSTKDGPIASASLSEANLFGTGRRARISAGRGSSTNTFGLSFSEPYMFSQRITGTADAFRSDASRESMGSRAYDEIKTGGKLSVSAPLTERFGASLHYSLIERRIDDVAERLSGSGSAGDPDLVSPGKTLASAVGYGLSFNGLDDPSDPSSGLHATFGQEFAGLGGDVRYLKSEATVDWYTPILPRMELVGHLGAKAGHVTGLGSPLGFADHFRSGSHVVRGFENDGFGPRDAATGFHLGGTAFASATAEAIMPMPLLPPEYGFKGVVFADAGSVWTPDSSKVAQSGASVVSGGAAFRASLGTGVLWDSPFGLLRADFAFPIAKEDDDRTQVFTFSGGTRF